MPAPSRVERRVLGLGRLRLAFIWFASWSSGFPLRGQRPTQ